MYEDFVTGSATEGDREDFSLPVIIFVVVKSRLLILEVGENVASVIFTCDFSSGAVIIELDCSNIEDKIEKVGTGVIFSVANTDFCIVVLGYKEVIPWDVRMELRVVSDASFPSEGSEGREMFKEIRESDGVKDKAAGFPVEMVVILSTCDLSGCVVNSVVSVPLRRASGDPGMDVL